MGENEKKKFLRVLMPEAPRRAGDDGKKKPEREIFEKERIRKRLGKKRRKSGYLTACQLSPGPSVTRHIGLST
jgi:hypothetical protein